MAATRSFGRHTTPEAWEQALCVAEGYLVGLAQAERVVTYSELGRIIGDATGHHPLSRSLGPFLDDLGRRTCGKYGVLLPALVVGKETGEPGEGFASLPQELGLSRAGESSLEAGRRLRSEVFRRFASTRGQLAEGYRAGHGRL